MKVHLKHGKVTQIMHGASRNYRYIWDVSDVTLGHIMRKLEKIELEMPSINKINELDRKIQGNLNRLDSSMHKIVKTLKTIKFLDWESSRIDNIEEIINTLGNTLSSIKTKKEVTPEKEEPKFVYVPKVHRPKKKSTYCQGS